MKKLFLSILLVSVPFLIFSQNYVWTNGSGDGKWSTASNWDSASVPNGIGAKVGFATTGNSDDIVNIELDMDATVGQIKTTTGGSNNINYKINDDGNNRTLTLGGGNSVTQIFQFNKPNSDIYFNVNVVITTGNSPQRFVANQAGFVEFGAGKTLTLNESLRIQGGSNKKCNVVFNGTTVMSDNSKNITFYKYATAKWSSTYSGANYLGSVYLGWSSDLSNTQSLSGTVEGKLEAKDLKIYKDTELTIETTGSVILSGAAFTQDSQSGRFVLKTSNTSSAALIAPGTADDAEVRLKFQRYTDLHQVGGSVREWTLIGVPVSGEEVHDVAAYLVDGTGAQATKTSLATWNPSDSEYVYQGKNGTGNYLAGGKGYAISPAAAGFVNFVGLFQEQDITRAVVDGTGTYGNWNAYGNPYSSYLNLTDDSGDATNNFLTVNAAKIHASYGAVYSWDGTTYDIHNNAADGIDYAAPGEGFSIYVADGASGDVSFTEAMQNASPASKANFNAGITRDGFKREASFKIKMEEQENNEYDYATFFFSDESTKGLDFGYDAGKFFLGPESKIYSRLVEEDEGIDFHLQSLAYDDLKDVVVPIGITTGSPSLKLSIKENTIDHLYRVYLEDRLKNTIVEFNKSIDISFEDDSNGIGRFYLHFTDGMIPELPTDGEDFRIFNVSNDEIRLMGSPETNYNAKVYDFSGRLVREVNFTHRININKIDSRGINILTIESKDKKLTKKFKLN